MADPELDQTDSEEGLGFDVLALLTGLRLRVWLLLAIAVLSCVIGVFSALRYGKRLYRSETILRYRKVGPDPAMGETNFILTQLNMIKLPSNIAQVRQKLELPASISAIGSAISANLQRNTSLITIQGIWDDPQTVASLTNEVRDVFLENSLQTRRLEAGKKIRDIQQRLDSVRVELEEAEEKLREFTTTYKVVDLSKEAQWYLEHLINLDLLFEQARIEERTVNLQLENLNKIIAGLTERVKQEAESNQQMENIGALNIKIRRLQDAIKDDKNYRAANIELEMRKAELERARELYSKKIIARSELEKAEAEYKKQKAMALDTEDTKAWKKEIDELKSVILPEEGKEAPSGEVLRSMMIRGFELDLTAVAINDKVEHLRMARDQIQKKLDQMPERQIMYASLKREVTAGENEKRTLESQLADIRSVFESNEYDFTVISEAMVPVYHHRSNRRRIAMGVSVAIFGFFSILIILVELLDTSVRSENDLELKLKLKVLGTLPKVDFPPADLYPSNNKEPAFIEEFRIIAQQVRRITEKKGAKLLVVSADTDEGKTLAATNIANCLGRTDEKVLIIDAQVRDVKESFSLDRLLAPGEDQPGLGDYLSFKATEASEIITHSFLARVSCIPRGTAAVIPDLLNSNRMKQLLNEVASDYSIVIIDSPAILKYVDADILASMADAAIMVVKSKKCGKSQLIKALERLQQTKIPVIGAILTDVNKVFLKK